MAASKLQQICFCYTHTHTHTQTHTHTDTHTHTLILQYLAEPENKELLKETTMTLGMSKGQEPNKRAPHGQSWNNLSEK